MLWRKPAMTRRKVFLIGCLPFLWVALGQQAASLQNEAVPTTDTSIFQSLGEAQSHISQGSEGVSVTVEFAEPQTVPVETITTLDSPMNEPILPQASSSRTTFIKDFPPESITEIVENSSQSQSFESLSSDTELESATTSTSSQSASEERAENITRTISNLTTTEAPEPTAPPTSASFDSVFGETVRLETPIRRHGSLLRAARSISSTIPIAVAAPTTALVQRPSETVTSSSSRRPTPVVRPTTTKANILSVVPEITEAQERQLTSQSLAEESEIAPGRVPRRRQLVDPFASVEESTTTPATREDTLRNVSGLTESTTTSKTRSQTLELPSSVSTPDIRSEKEESVETGTPVRSRSLFDFDEVDSTNNSTGSSLPTTSDVTTTINEGVGVDTKTFEETAPSLPLIPEQVNDDVDEEAGSGEQEELDFAGVNEDTESIDVQSTPEDFEELGGDSGTALDDLKIEGEDDTEEPLDPNISEADEKLAKDFVRSAVEEDARESEEGKDSEDSQDRDEVPTREEVLEELENDKDADKIVTARAASPNPNNGLANSDGRNVQVEVDSSQLDGSGGSGTSPLVYGGVGAALLCVAVAGVFVVRRNKVSTRRDSHFSFNDGKSTMSFQTTSSDVEKVMTPSELYMPQESNQPRPITTILNIPLSPNVPMSTFPSLGRSAMPEAATDYFADFHTVKRTESRDSSSADISRQFSVIRESAETTVVEDNKESKLARATAKKGITWLMKLAGGKTYPEVNHSDESSPEQAESTTPLQSPTVYVDKLPTDNATFLNGIEQKNWSLLPSPVLRDEELGSSDQLSDEMRDEADIHVDEQVPSFAEAPGLQESDEEEMSPMTLPPLTGKRPQDDRSYTGSHTDSTVSTETSKAVEAALARTSLSNLLESPTDWSQTTVSDEKLLQAWEEDAMSEIGLPPVATSSVGSDSKSVMESLALMLSSDDSDHKAVAKGEVDLQRQVPASAIARGINHRETLMTETTETSFFSDENYGSEAHFSVYHPEDL